jgi:hypothetical protein
MEQLGTNLGGKVFIKSANADGAGGRLRRGSVSFLSTLAVIASSALAVVATAPPAQAASTGTGTSYTLEGCRNNGTITLPDGSGRFVCPDSAYTTGNLGKGWNELDLVPIRFTVAAGNSAPASQDFAFTLVVDNEDAGHPGYDVLSSDSGGTPVLNATLSSGTCGTLTAGPQQYLTPGLGGTDTSLYRLLTVTGQGKNSTCVYDAYARLALGSHLFPGASLHFNLANDAFGTQGIGAKDVSIPVKEILPQELSKDMTATQDTDHIWSITKSPSPATVSFANTCVGSSSFTANVDIKVEWEKLPASPSGDITVLTHVYATNPASRIITVNVEDAIRSGATVLDTAGSGDVDVPANTANYPVLTHSTTVPSGTTDLNDVATATYTDKVTGVAVPGTTQATASATVQSSGLEKNQTAVITDVESITGAGFDFTVNSTTGASGSFDGYTTGTYTTGPVTWKSDVQTGSGSVTFHKTIRSQAANVGSGTLSDKATLTGSDGFTTDSSASVNVSANATGSVSVSKTASLSIASPLAFTFHLQKDGVGTGDTATVNLPASSTGPVSSNTISGLSVDGALAYSFHEDATAPYPSQDTASRSFALVLGDPSSCALTFPVVNSAPPASARVKKDTVPASSGDWTFTLTGPNALSETLTDVEAGGGYDAFSSALTVDGGTYTITETQQAGYDLTGVSGDFGGDAARVTTSTPSRTCSFTLDLTTDSGKVLSCGFTNTARGTIIVKKITDPSTATEKFAFAGDASGSIGNGETITVGNLVPGTYYSTETVPAGWDLTDLSCDDAASATPSTTSKADAKATFELDPGETVTCTFTNTQRGKIIVKKVTDPSGAAQSFEFDPSYGSHFFLKDGESNDSGYLVPGTYSVGEITPTGWDLTGSSCDDGSSAGSIGLDPGETVTCTFTNTQRGKIIVVKQTDPDGSTQSFEFDPSYGANFFLKDGESNDSGYLQPGTYSVSENAVAGWDLTSATCSDGSDPASIGLGAGEVVTCTFTNVQRGTIIVKKVTDPTTATQKFDFTGDAAGSIGNGETITVGNLVPGTYTSTETVPAGWDLTGLTCDDGSSATPSTTSKADAKATFELDAGETVTCTFTNTERGTIIVKKVTDPTTATQKFDFTGDAAGSIGNGETITVGNLVPGTYTSTEGAVTGWDLVALACDDSTSPTPSTTDLGNAKATFELDPGETVTCTFTNRMRGTAKVIKTVANSDGSNPQAPTGTEAFTFELRQGATPIIGNPGTVLETQVADAGNGGQFTFAELLVPGDHYQVCEQLPAPGWVIELGPDQFVPEQFLADGQTLNPGVVNDVYCVDFVAQVGPEPTVFNVLDKRPPGGFGLTIGYWKNWASCTKSAAKKQNSLDLTLFEYGSDGLVVSATSGGWPVFGPTYWLVLTSGADENNADDCDVAVSLLDKRAVDTGRKMANDPAFNLAAQLVAAQLNYKADAATTVTNEINASVLLLGKYKFDGSTHTKISKQDAAAMNDLAHTLDLYNNNLL